MSEMIKTEQSKLFESSKILQPSISNHRYVDKNIHETIQRIQSYEIHQKKLIRIKEELERNRMKKANGDVSYEHLKSQMTHNKLRSHEFQETEKITEIKRSNQILLEKLLDISKGKRCDVKQENLSAIIPQGTKSLNYQVKKKEAERIDSENQKIMERIVKQNPSLSSKKMHQDYVEQLRYKKMKEQKLGLSIEKIMEKKRKMVMEARSTILPLLNAKNNTPGEEINGRNSYFVGGTIDAQSQRYQQTSLEDRGDGLNQINIITKGSGSVGGSQYQNLNTSMSGPSTNNRFMANRTQMNKISQSVTPKSQRSKRPLARSELSEYQETQNNIHSYSFKKKANHKIVLESIPQSNSSTIQQNKSINKNSSISNGMLIGKLNKPPVVPTPLNNQMPKIGYSINQSVVSSTKANKKSIEIPPPVQLSSLNKSYAQQQQNDLKMNNFYSHTSNNSNSKTKNNTNSSVTNKNVPFSNQQMDEISNKSSNQEQTPKVAMDANLRIHQSNSIQQIKDKNTVINQDQADDQIIDEEIIDQEVNQINSKLNTSKKRSINDDVVEEDQIFDDEDYINSHLSSAHHKNPMNNISSMKNTQRESKNKVQSQRASQNTKDIQKINTSEKQPAIQKQQTNKSQIDASVVDYSKQYLERNSILSGDPNDTSKNLTKGKDDREEDYEEVFDEEVE